MATKLTTAEQERLAELCGIVRRGMETFVEVGSALMEIRESGLYRDRCSTFEAFVQIEFGFSRQHAYKQIAAAEVVAGMSHNATKPESLTTALPLAALPPEQRTEAFEEAREVAKTQGKKVQAKHVTAAVAARRKEKKATKYESPDEMAAKLTAPKSTPPSVAAVPARPSGAEKIEAGASEAPEVSAGISPDSSVTSTDSEQERNPRGSTGPRNDEAASSPDPVITPAVVEVGVVSQPTWLAAALAVPVPMDVLSNAQAAALDEATCARLDTLWLAIKQAVARARARRVQSSQEAA